MTDGRVPAVVHLDLDGIPDIFRVHGWPLPAREGDPLFDRGLPRALDFFESTGVRATLFVIARSVERSHARARLREAVERGHSVASHSTTHRRLEALPSEEKRREIFESRERIQDALGAPVAGFRAPDLSIDRECLELVAEAGYAWDSSLLPTAACARRVGLARVAPEPHRPLEGAGLVELPLPDHAPLPLPFHPSYSLVLGGGWFRWGLRRFRRSGHPLVLLLHLTDLCDPLGRDWTPSWRARFFTLSFLSGERKRLACARMLGAVRRSYRITETASLLAGWERAA